MHVIEEVMEQLVDDREDFNELISFAENNHTVQEDDYYRMLEDIGLGSEDNVEQGQVYIDYITFSSKLES